ncbi:hypothetical protein ACFOVU_18650 [Nocardiopsis sediminis]|uniref:Flagellar export protein FliJ n=1 Tax=Nocardiopsis sediminis TaxID=1778267 RepID=A0ABV8FST5_9ACTN
MTKLMDLGRALVDRVIVALSARRVAELEAALDAARVRHDRDMAAANRRADFRAEQLRYTIRQQQVWLGAAWDRAEAAEKALKAAKEDQ